MGEAREKALQAREAARVLAQSSTEERNRALIAMAELLCARETDILAANKRDQEYAQSQDTPLPLVDRLMLNHDRIVAMSEALKDIARQADPLGQVVRGGTLPQGIQFSQIRVPLGVVAMIYEARPNVTVDAGGLCIKTGNAVILKGGSLARHSNLCLTQILSDALEQVGLPRNGVVSIESSDRAVTEELMGLVGIVDVLIPRGGAPLIASCVKNAKIPVIETGVGNCHIYVQETANLDMALDIIKNAKLSRPGVCNACESVLLDENLVERFGKTLSDELVAAGVKVHVDAALERAVGTSEHIMLATEDDFAREYLDLEISIACVKDYRAAVEHINRYGTRHSEAIVTADYEASQYFLDHVDAAAVYVNASTRFTDGGMFGLGAEIGISTQKMHARGPMGAEVLTSTKYVLRGSGQIR